MTVRKADIRLPARTPAYVSREVGAAELQISPETWDRWVEDGILPPAAPGFPQSTPRWKWADVDRMLSAPLEHLANDDPFMAGAERMKNGTPQKRKSRVT
jgi:hypothetical protein